MLSDTHLHTHLSPDAEQAPGNTVSDYLAAARKTGLQYIAITEHCDIYPDEASGYVNADLHAYAAEFAAAQREILEKGSSPVRLLYGIELAHAHTQPVQAAQVLQDHRYDFVLGSLHVSRDGTDYWGMDYNAFDDQTLMTCFQTYAQELYEIADSCDFDSLAHCTYPLRYYARNGRLAGLCAEPSRFIPLYTDIFRRLIARGKALEINTSGFAAGENFLPGRDLLLLYRKLGGQLVTVGSDAHSVKNMASGVDAAEALLCELGFEGVTVFVERKARLIPFGEAVRA